MDQLKGGLADKMKPEDFDSKELEMGIKIEMEHVDDKALAKEIAMDHLAEDPKYYTKLKKIEPQHEASNISPHRNIDKDEMFKAQRICANRHKVRPQDLEFVGSERYASGMGYYFNIKDKRHSKYMSTVVEMI